MPWFMAKPIYILTTSDGREVGILYETQAARLVIRLDPAFHETERRRRSDVPAESLARLVVSPVEGG